MARPYFTAKHIESMDLLPDTLEIGRAYFVDDEQVIVIDHGRGPVIYGGATGPQGIAGEPIPQLQGQIDNLVDAELTTQKTIWDINKREVQEAEKTARSFEIMRNDIKDKYQSLEELIINESVRRESAIATLDANLRHDFTESLQEEAQARQDAVDTLRTDLTTALQGHADRIDSALNILAKSISNLYPEHYAPEDSQDDPLDNETFSTDSGSWTIQQTVLKDGTVVLNLTPQEQVIDTLSVGDSVDFDGNTWLIEDITTTDGVTSITLKP